MRLSVERSAKAGALRQGGSFAVTRWLKRSCIDKNSRCRRHQAGTSDRLRIVHAQSCPERTRRRNCRSGKGKFVSLANIQPNSRRLGGLLPTNRLINWVRTPESNLGEILDAADVQEFRCERASRRWRRPRESPLLLLCKSIRFGKNRA